MAMMSARGHSTTAVGDESVPKTEHAVRDGIKGPSRGFFRDRRLLFQDVKGDQISEIDAACAALHGDLRRYFCVFRAARGDGTQNRVVAGRFADLLFQKVPRFLEKIYGRIQKVFRSEEHTSELQSLSHLVCRLLLEKKKTHV